VSTHDQNLTTSDAAPRTAAARQRSPRSARGLLCTVIMKKLGACATLVFAASATLTGAAPRAARATEAVAPPAAEKESYSMHVVVADLASLGMVFSGFPPLQSAAVASYVFASPVIHLVHGHPGRAAGSLGLRLLLPFGAALGGAALENCRDSGDLDFCGLGGALAGGLVGLVAASVIDATLLAGADGGNAQAPPERAPALFKVASVTVDRAGIAPQRNGAGLMLGGTF
jgi:hypothetical protein